MLILITLLLCALDIPAADDTPDTTPAVTTTPIEHVTWREIKTIWTDTAPIPARDDDDDSRGI